MKKSIRLCSLMMVCVMFFCSLPLSASASTNLSGKTIIVFGDSLTNFGGRSYADIVETKLGIDILNKGIGGENTYNGRVRLETDILANNPDVVIMCFCSNDQAMTREQLIPCIPIDGYRENLIYMIEKMQAQGTEIIFFTPNPVAKKYTPWGYFLHYNYEEGKVLDDFCNVLREVAIEYNITLIDLHREYDVIGDYEDYFLSDGLHQSDIGYNFYAEKVTAHLEALYDNKNKASVTVNCVDADGNELKTFTMTGADGANITIATPVIKGYTPTDADINTVLRNGDTYTLRYENSLRYKIDIAKSANEADYHAMAWTDITEAVEAAEVLLENGASASVCDSKAAALEELISRTGNYEYVVSQGKSYTATDANRNDGYNSNKYALTDGTKAYPNGNNTNHYYAWDKPSGATENTVEIVVDLGTAQKMNVFNTYLASSSTWGINPPSINTSVEIYVSNSTSFGNTPVATATASDAEMLRKFSTWGGDGAQVVDWTTYIMKAKSANTVQGRYVKFVISKNDGTSFIWLDQVEAAYLPTYIAPNEPEVISTYASYTRTEPNRNDNYDDDGYRLTNGIKGKADGGTCASAGWNCETGANSNTVEIVVDLGSAMDHNTYTVYTSGNPVWSIEYPHDTNAIVKISVSDDADGEFTPVTSAYHATPIAEALPWAAFTLTAQTDEVINARYVKFEITKCDGGNNFIWLDEVEVGMTEATAYNLPYDPESEIIIDEDDLIGEDDGGNENTDPELIPDPNPEEPPVDETLYNLGDVNKSGDIDMMDYILLKRNYFGTFDFDAEQLTLGDCNESGDIDMMDYILLKRAYFGTFSFISGI